MQLVVDWTAIGQNAAFAGLTLVALFITKILHDLLTPFDDDLEIRDKANVALALRRVGLYIGTATALLAPLMLPGSGSTADLQWFAIDVAIVIVAMLIASLLCDKLVLKGIKVREGIANGNVAVGLVEMGLYLALGLILSGAFSGEGPILAGIAFAGLGFVGLAISFWIYEGLTKWNVVEQISSGNVAAGLVVAARLIALGVVLQLSVAGDFEGWESGLASFGSWFLGSLIFLEVMNWVADLLFLPKAGISEQVVERRNVASATTVAAVLVASSIVVWATFY